MPYSVIEGQVVDEDGSPTTEFKITTLRATRSAGRWKYIATGTPLKVDDMGRFRIANLLPGRFKLVAVPTRRVEPAENIANYVSTFYPSSLFIADAESIPVDGGKEARATIRLRKERVFNVQGKVIDAASGAALSGFLLILNPTQGNHSGSITPNAPVSTVRDGSFYFKDVIPGSYSIEPSNMVMIVNGSSRLESKFFGHHQVMVKDHDLSDVLVPLQAGVIVRGKLIQQAQDKPLSTKSVVRLSAVSSLGRDFSANVSTDGTFEILTVAPEQYRIHVLNLPEGSYLKTASSGDQDVTITPLDLSSGVGATLAITISPKAATATGSVYRESSGIAADVLVTLAPTDASRRSDPGTSRKARTDQNGQFVLKNLPPGEYRILAWEEIDDELAVDPEFRSAFDAQSARIELSEGSNLHVDLRKLVSEDSAKFEASKIR